MDLCVRSAVVLSMEKPPATQETVRNAKAGEREWVKLTIESGLMNTQNKRIYKCSVLSVTKKIFSFTTT